MQPVCTAQREGAPEKYPVKTRKLKRSTESWWLLWAQDAAGRVWLQRRPDSGVWAGLYCLPVFDSRNALEAQAGLAPLRDLPVFLHVLTHKDLYLHPVQLQLPADVRPGPDGDWVAAADWPAMGLPAPIRKLLADV